LIKLKYQSRSKRFKKKLKKEKEFKYIKLSLSCKTKKLSLMSKITLFGQIIQKLDLSIFKKLVQEHKTDKHQKGFDSWSHLTSMLFCHFAKS